MNDELLKKIQVDISYFSKKQDVYDKLDNELAKFNHVARGRVVPRVKTCFQYIFLLSVVVMFVSYRWLVDIGMRSIIFDFDFFLGNYVHLFLVYALFPFMVSALASCLLYLLYRRIKYRVIEASIDNRRDKIIEVVRELSMYYNDFEEVNRMKPIMNSYKWCNARELIAIENILLARDADTIPDARAILLSSGELIDYSMIPRSFEVAQSEMARIKGDEQTYKQEELKQERRKERQASNEESKSNDDAKNRDNREEASSVYFNGIDDLASLKKRYHALMKAYHTDGEVGDTDTAQKINEEYNKLKKKLK